MTTSERFLEVMKGLKISPYVLEFDCGLKNAQAKISHYKKGVTKAISGDIIIQLCESYPQVNANYILTGRGSMFLENEISALSEERKEDDGNVSLTYDELSRLHKTTVLRYERLFKNLKSEFEKLEETIVKADGELNKALEDVRVVIKKQKTA
jgi:hypothetical protein